MQISYLGMCARKVHSFSAMVDFYLNSRSDSVGEAPEEIIEFAYRHYPITPRQVRSEVLRFARLINMWRPAVLVEIGTHAGGTFFVLCRCAHPEATVISIDLPGAQFSGGRPKLVDVLLPRMPLKTQTFHRLQGDSHDPRSVKWLERILQGRRIDVLLIDGDHTYEGVKTDFEMYRPLVRTGGLVALHDVVSHTRDTKCKVDVFWQEIRAQYRHEELIEDRDQGWAGIGVLYV